MRVDKNVSPPSADWLRISLIVIALAYAFLAGLRTVADFDLGWQLATGRYILHHHLIPSTEVFSYTAHGNPWLYPPFSGVIFYLLYLAGGYAALSWLSALACLATVAIIAGQGTRTSAALAIVAVPAIAFRTVPRAELFTTILFAAFTAILWNHYQGGKARLFLLPLLMLAWVNLHTGFIAGLGLVAAYFVLEFCDLPFAARRAAALDSMRRAFPWLFASFVATRLNPWGWRIYQVIARQNAMSQLHTDFIGEWSGVHFSSAIGSQIFSLRDPAGADWWLLAAAFLAIVATISRKEIGPAILLALGAYASLTHIRLQALFAILVCIVGGAILSREFRLYSVLEPPPGERSSAPPDGAPRRALIACRASWAIAGLLALLAGIRVTDLVTDRYYLWSGQIALFGAGESWWFPERAAGFLLKEHLPGNVFGDYNLGGYLTWRLGPEYPDYFDGRFIPFGSDLFFHHRALVGLPLDSPEWRQEAVERNIQTVIFSAARFGGLGNFPLQADCESRDWSPVYLDDVAVVFVRNVPENASLVHRLAIDCKKGPIPVPAASAAGASWRASAELFQSLMNRASIYYLLSRDAEAADDLSHAQAIFADDPNLHLLRGQLAQAHNRPPEAEQEYQASVRLRPTDVAWYALAGLYAAEGRYSDAVYALRESAALSQVDYDRYRALGKVYLLMDDPQNALAAFEEAARRSPIRGPGKDPDPEFGARVAEGTAAAYRKLGKLDLAIAAQRRAVDLTPGAAGRWQALAELYQSEGHSSQAAEAHRHSAMLAVPERNNP
jgi:tetratricopeptide (TPR) repeat protein